MSFKVDDAEYMRGAAAFSRGDTLRAIADHLGADKGQPITREHDDAALSFVLGYADEFLLALRRVQGGR